MEGDIGWDSSSKRRCKEVLRLWNRMVKMENSRLTKKIFNNDYELWKTNWCDETKISFNKLDKIDIFQNKDVCNIDMLMEIYDRIYNNE